MKIERGRPVIQENDFPLTVYHSLGGNAQDWVDNRPYEEADAWNHKIGPDARGNIRDCFRIMGFPPYEQLLRADGETVIYTSIDQLEFALVAYGLSLMHDRSNKAEHELLEVDQILTNLDLAIDRPRVPQPELTS